MLNSGCPPWEYSYIDGHDEIIGSRIKDILVDLAEGRIDKRRTAGDTRQVHARIFRGLTPTLCEYYAGNYRGSDLVCLKHRQVYVGGDPRVGILPQDVSAEISLLRTRILSGSRQIERAIVDMPDAVMKVLNIIRFICEVFVEFLRIHPYLNGNGHAGRYLLWALLLSFGYAPRRFTIHPRPQDSNFIPGIIEFRNGNEDPLMRYILATLQ